MILAETRCFRENGMVNWRKPSLRIGLFNYQFSQNEMLLRYDDWSEYRVPKSSASRGAIGVERQIRWKGKDGGYSYLWGAAVFLLDWPEDLWDGTKNP